MIGLLDYLSHKVRKYLQILFFMICSISIITKFTAYYTIKNQDQEYYSIRMSLQEQIENETKSNPVVVYSKSYCPYCMKTKHTLSKLNVDYVVVELNELSNGDEIQNALRSMTGQSTVPNIFIGGTSVGGNSDLSNLHSQGMLVPLLEQAGAL